MKYIAFIINCILFIISVPFIIISLIDYLKTNDFIDIIIFLAFIIPAILSSKYMISSWKKYNQQYKQKSKLDQLSLPPSIQEPKVPLTDLNKNLTTSSTSKFNDNITFPKWYISISFGKSTSENYDKAVTLAKAAPQYLEQVNSGNILHQAIYSSKPKDYLAFIMLYELVGNWKSSFVIINGKLIDRKIIGKLNYCYGDKCRSGNKKFCYGASYMTENPFGCHRLQVSAANNPWWSYYHKILNRWVLDKEALQSKIKSKATIYCICPDFDYDNIIKELNKLPVTLSDKQMKQLSDSNFGLKM